MAKRNALGKGLGALIPGADATPADKITSEIAPSPTGQTQRQIIEIPIDDIEPNPHQPRTEFDPKAVGELAQSIREKGIIQPVSVRRFGSGYQLIAGERRFPRRASGRTNSRTCNRYGRGNRPGNDGTLAN